MKRKVIATFVVVICMAMIGYGTIAYFTHEDKATNVITSGNLCINLKETTAEGKPFTDVINVMPAQKVSKIVQVENTGDQAAYIRIKVEKSIKLASGTHGTPDIGLIFIDFDNVNWIESDGYYYYSKPLQPGEATSALFKTVTFAPEMSNMYQNSKATIRVIAQATQVKNNGSSVLEAAGWPELE